MLRTWKTATVWGMTLLTAATPASACRGRFWGGQSACYSGYSSYSSYCNVQCAPAAGYGEVYSGSDCGFSSPAPTGTYSPAPTDTYQPVPSDNYPPAPTLAPSPAQPAPSYRPAPAPVQPVPADELPPVEPPTA